MLAFYILASSPLVANGVQESRVAQARQLIAEKNYNEAILILTKVVREEPDRQDEAQELINEVMRLRNQYNSDYEKVLDLLYVQDNVDEALKIITQIEAVDKNPNKQQADDVKQMKRGAQIKFYNKRYNDIMARALVFLNQRQYSNAVQVYLEGQDLARDMFLEEDYGNVLTNQVDRAWEDLKGAAALFVQAEARLKTLGAQGAALLTSDTGAGLEPVLAPLRDLASWRQRVWNDGRLFLSQNQFLVRNGRQEDSYLEYSRLLLHGPPDSPTQEGVLGAMDRLWSEVLDPWTAQVRNEVETRYTRAKLALDQERYPEARQAFESLRLKARQGLDVVTLWNRLAGIDATGQLDASFRVKLNQVLPLGVWMEHRLLVAAQGAQTSQDLPRVAALAANATLDRPTLEAARADARTQKLNFGLFGQTVTTWSRQAASLGSQGFSLLDPTPFFSGWQAQWADYRQRALNQESTFVNRRGTLDYGLLDGRFQSVQASLTGARNQVEGTIKYPLQAVAKLNEIRPVQDALAQDIGTFVATYEGESADVKTSAVLLWPGRGRELLSRLVAAQTLQGQLLSAAQVNYAKSQDLRRQGQALEAQVTVATNAENFTKAKADLNTMSVNFAESLRFQEDAAFRSESDDLVKTLGDLILRAENEVVVREVRALITQGSESYLAQQFRNAEQILLRAQKRWADTNKDPNTEVDYWLNLTSFALSVNAGREVSPIDPLYNEIQQMLNFARRDYTRGQDRLNEGDREAGLALMAQATATLSKIFVTAPQNQEAGLLKLEILKASDPENFPTVYKQNFDAAVARINSGEAQLAYTDLQDLDKIQPNYPGMAAAIKSVRLKLGLDKAAVDLVAQARARTLVTQATRLFNQGSQAQLTQAQTLVNQALLLDAKNTAAQDLIDKISLKIRNFVATLTPTQRGELNDMLDLLRNQRTLEALAKITEFKANYPAVANDSYVKEVERRIKAFN